MSKGILIDPDREKKEQAAAQAREQQIHVTYHRILNVFDRHEKGTKTTIAEKQKLAGFLAMKMDEMVRTGLVHYHMAVLRFIEAAPIREPCCAMTKETIIHALNARVEDILNAQAKRVEQKEDGEEGQAGAGSGEAGQDEQPVGGGDSGNEAKEETVVGIAQVVASLCRASAISNGNRGFPGDQVQILEAGQVGAGVLFGAQPGRQCNRLQRVVSLSDRLEDGHIVAGLSHLVTQEVKGLYAEHAGVEQDFLLYVGGDRFSTVESFQVSGDSTQDSVHSYALCQVIAG